MNYQETSREALESIEGVSGEIDKKIVSVIRARTGATDEEVEDQTGMKHQTISANRRHLVERGVLRDSGQRRNTRSGRSAIVWILGSGTQKPAPRHRKAWAVEQLFDTKREAIEFLTFLKNHGWPVVDPQPIELYEVLED